MSAHNSGQLLPRRDILRRVGHCLAEEQTSLQHPWRDVEGRPATQPHSHPASSLSCVTGPMVRTWFSDTCLLTAEAPSAVRMCHKVLCAHAVFLLVIGCNSALWARPTESRRQPVSHVADTVAVTGAVLGSPGLSESFIVETLTGRYVCQNGQTSEKGKQQKRMRACQHHTSNND